MIDEIDEIEGRLKMTLVVINSELLPTLIAF